MKKTYLQPNIKVIKFTTSPLMLTGSSVSNTEAEDDALSRGYTIFDDAFY